jgi:hypothetical protein
VGAVDALKVRHTLVQFVQERLEQWHHGVPGRFVETGPELVRSGRTLLRSWRAWRHGLQWW